MRWFARMSMGARIGIGFALIAVAMMVVGGLAFHALTTVTPGHRPLRDGAGVDADGERDAGGGRGETGERRRRGPAATRVQLTSLFARSAVQPGARRGRHLGRPCRAPLPGGVEYPST